jgi:hypothetical protein
MTAGVTYTHSAIVKAGSSNFVGISSYDGSNNYGAMFNLATGTFVGYRTDGAGGTHLANSITSLGGGWYRVSFTYTAANTYTGFSAQIIISQAGNLNFATSCVAGTSIIAFAYQMEAGSFATSYIPTTTGTLARSADVCSVTTAGWSNAGNDTMVVEYFVERTTNAILVEGGPSISWMTIGFATTNRQRNLYRHGGSSTRVDAQTADNSVSFVSINKTALTSGEQIALNGSLSQTLLGDPPQSDISTILSIGRRSDFGGAGYLNGHIAAIRYYKKRLSNAKLAQLTV